MRLDQQEYLMDHNLGHISSSTSTTVSLRLDQFKEGERFVVVKKEGTYFHIHKIVPENTEKTTSHAANS